MSKRRSVLYFPYSTLFSRVKGHKGSPVLPPVLPRPLPSNVMGGLLRRAHFESLRAAEAKNTAKINQLKYRSRSCITGNIALGMWSRANKALSCDSCFIGSRPRPRAIFPVMHSHGTLTSIIAQLRGVIMYFCLLLGGATCKYVTTVLAVVLQYRLLCNSKTALSSFFLCIV